MNKYTDYMCNCQKEIMEWRQYFIDDIILGNSPFKYMPESEKLKLKTYFLSIPSLSFTNPWNEINKYIAQLTNR